MKRRQPTTPEYARGANPALADAMRGLAGNLTHGDRRLRRRRDRSTQRRVAIQDSRE